MDNMIKKFNEELKYYFPESRLEAVLFEIPLSESKSIDIRGDLNVMEFYKFLNFNKIWITENLQKYFHVENWKDYNVHPQKAGLGTFTKIAFTNEEAQKRGCMNMQYFDPILYTEVVFTETTEFKVQHPLQIFYMSVYIIFDAFIKRYEDMLLAHKEAKDVESLTPESAKKELYEFEGLFYQLFANKSGRRIGYGMVNDEYPAADIREFEKTQNPKQGQLIIISGFSRAGKNAIADGLNELSDNYIYSVSATTRQPRPGERNEVDYFFITSECFANLEESGGFLESAEYCGNKYGTLASPVVKALEEGRDMILVLETEGAMKVKSLYPTAISFFVAAPAPDLKARMERTETTEEDRRNRLAQIRKEISMIPKYDYLIMNGNGMLEKNIELVHNIIKGQKAKTSANLDVLEQLRKEY